MGVSTLYTKGYRIGRRDTEVRLAARIEELEMALREARGPLAELVVAYQDADSPAIQDTLRRARAALAPEQDK